MFKRLGSRALDRRTFVKAGAVAGLAQFAAPFIISARADAPIKIGMIDSVASLLGPDTFSGPMYGAQAFFKALNAQGGRGGYVDAIACPDGIRSGAASCQSGIDKAGMGLALLAR